MQVRTCSALLKSFAIVVLAVVTTPFLRAKDVAVDCSGATPGAFTTINAALSALALQGPNSITITGTCMESFTIRGFNDLTLQGSGTAVIQPGPNAAPVGVIRSQGITVKGPLIFDGSVILIQRNSDLSLSNVTIQNGPGHGIESRDSILDLANSTIKNSRGQGIFLQGGSLSLSGSTITANGEDGVSAVHAHTSMTTANVISNNTGSGMTISGTSAAELFGDNHIDGNGSAGIFATDTSALLMVGGETLNNKLSGVSVGQTSSAYLKNLKISGNGSPGLPEVDAIDVARNAHVFLAGGVDISANTQGGIFVLDGAVLTSFGSNTINNNGVDGVLLKGSAVAHWLTPDTITGNARFSLHCDNTSLVEADVSGLAHVKCGHIAPR
jgi:hypothetical protein